MQKKRAEVLQTIWHEEQEEHLIRFASAGAVRTEVKQSTPDGQGWEEATIPDKHITVLDNGSFRCAVCRVTLLAEAAMQVMLC